MNLLAGKKALILGVANKYSIAWGIAEAFKKAGAEVGLSYAIDRLERRVRPLAESIDIDFVEQCDLSDDAQIATLFEKAQAHFGTLDILIHAVAYAERDDLTGTYYQTSRSGFATAMDISVFSLVAATRAALPMMQENGGSILSLTYYGAEKVIPHYNVMGVAKAALEASTRYLAADLGPHRIRVNAISAGPIKTMSAAGINDFRKLLNYVAERAPLQGNVTPADVADTALWLCSDLGRAVTGEIVHVDGGYNILGMPEPRSTWEKQ